MSAKEYLNQIRTLGFEIGKDKARLKELDSEIGGLKAIDYARDKVQTSTNADLSGCVAELIELQNKVAKEIVTMQTKRQQIISEIRQLSNTEYIVLLTLRYIDCVRWEQIAVEMNLTLRRVYQLHGDALQSFKSTKDFI